MNFEVLIDGYGGVYLTENPFTYYIEDVCLYKYVGTSRLDLSVEYYEDIFIKSFIVNPSPWYWGVGPHYNTSFIVNISFLGKISESYP